MALGIGRREFLRYSGMIAAMLGLSQGGALRVAHALEHESAKRPLIWLDGQSCGGCTDSLLGSADPTAGRILTELISLRFSTALSGLSGAALLAEAGKARDTEGHILVVEGSISTASDGGFSVIGHDESEVKAKDLVVELSEGAGAVIAVGTCASFGGIPAASGADTGATPVGDIIDTDRLINVSGCPPHPDWIVASIVHMLLYGTIPARDGDSRPTFIYEQRVHDLCERRAAFDDGRFVNSFSEVAEGEDRCMAELGCKGPIAHGDCPTRRFNSGTNWCVGANVPCTACTEHEFYEAVDPLLFKIADLTPPLGGAGVSADRVATIAVGATAAGILGHAAVTGTSRLIASRRKERSKLDIDMSTDESKDEEQDV